MSYRKREDSWSFALEPYILAVLQDVFPDMVWERDASAYLFSLQQQQIRIRQAIHDEQKIESAPFLRSYQHNAVRFLAEAKRCILGFPTGGGKTVISCAAVKELKLRRVLVVGLNSIKWNWKHELNRFAGRDDVRVVESTWRGKVPKDVITGNKEEREKQLDNFFKNNKSGVVIMNYTNFITMQALLYEIKFDCVIFDEAHRLKNHKKRGKGAAQTPIIAEGLAQLVPYVWLLTATPIHNSQTDLFQLLRIIHKRRFSSFDSFLHIHTIHTVDMFNQPKVIGLRDEQYFQGMLSHYMYRMDKKELMPMLPDKEYMNVYVDMPQQQRKVYDEMEHKFRVQVSKEIKGQEVILPEYATNVISQLIALRQICLSPQLVSSSCRASGKLEYLEDFFTDIKKSGEKVLVFSRFRGFLGLIEPILKKLSVPYAEIHGKINTQDRVEAQRKLDAGEIQVILGTIHAMGEGMNLQSASIAVFCDMDYVPAVNEQAEDRIHRGDIVNSPTIIRLIHRGTVEEDIMEVCRRKQEIATETVGMIEVIRSMLSRT